MAFSSRLEASKVIYPQCDVMSLILLASTVIINIQLDQLLYDQMSGLSRRMRILSACTLDKCISIPDVVISNLRQNSLALSFTFKSKWKAPDG